MAKTSRKTAAKKQGSAKKAPAKTKSPASKRSAAAKPKAKPSAAAAQKEYTELHKRSQVIWKDLDSANAATSQRAEATWNKFISDFQVWAKKYGLTLEQQEKKHDHTDDPTPFSHSANTHGCAPSYSGHKPNGTPFVCHFVRYSRVRDACIYTCGVDPNGTAIPPDFM
jgi:hypothetical protein